MKSAALKEMNEKEVKSVNTNVSNIDQSYRRPRTFFLVVFVTRQVKRSTYKSR